MLKMKRPGMLLGPVSPPLSCDCYGGCWGDHSATWSKMVFHDTADANEAWRLCHQDPEIGVQRPRSERVPHGSYVLAGRPPVELRFADAAIMQGHVRRLEALGALEATQAAPSAINHRYSCVVRWSEEDEAFVATVPEFPRLSGIGPTRALAVEEVCIAVALAVEVLREDGREVPDPRVLTSGRSLVAIASGVHTEERPYRPLSPEDAERVRDIAAKTRDAKPAEDPAVTLLHEARDLVSFLSSAMDNCVTSEHVATAEEWLAAYDKLNPTPPR